VNRACEFVLNCAAIKGVHEIVHDLPFVNLILGRQQQNIRRDVLVGFYLEGAADFAGIEVDMRASFL